MYLLSQTNLVAYLVFFLNVKTSVAGLLQEVSSESVMTILK